MERIKIGEVCNILNGYAFKSEKYVDSGIRIIRIANVQKGYIEDNSPAFYPSNSCGLEKYILEEGDLLISLTGNVGRVAILEKAFLPAALNQRVACLRMKSNVVSKKYLFHLLNSDYFEQRCIHSSKGVAQKNMSTEWLKEYEIPLYSINMQEHIIATLDKLQSIITHRKQQLAKLDELVKARFVEMFGDPVSDTKGWGHKPLKEMLVSIRYGTSTPPEFSDEGYAFIRATNIKNGQIVDKDMKYIPEHETERLEKCRLSGGEIIIVRSGVNAGDTCVVTPEYIGQYAGYDMILVLNETLNPIFLNTLINTSYMEKIVKPMTRRAAQPHLNSEQTQSFPIICVPIELQDQFAAFVEQTDKSKVAVQKALDEAQLLFDSLMQEYFG
ncbi:MAG: restriction endonuclease subunit S [Oscillospiraceae bacterium]